MIEVIDLSSKFDLFTEFWQPRIVGELNDGYVKLAKLKGEFMWHSHESEDEMFLVVRGALTVRLRDRDLDLRQGQLVIIPRGIEHLPVAKDEVHVLLLEPKTTVNTGDQRNERTVEASWI